MNQAQQITETSNPLPKVNSWKIFGMFVLVWIVNATIAKMISLELTTRPQIEITALCMQLALTGICIILCIKKRKKKPLLWLLPIWTLSNIIQPLSFFLQLILLGYFLYALEKNNSSLRAKLEG